MECPCEPFCETALKALFFLSGGVISLASMEACVGARHLSRRLIALGHDGSSFDEHFQGLVVAGTAKDLVGLKDLRERKVVSEPGRIELFRFYGLEQHWGGHRVDKARRDRNVMTPEPLQMQVNLCAMDAHIRNGSPPLR